MTDFINRMFSSTTVRSTIAVLIVLLSFGLFYKVVWDDHITVEKLSVITAIIGINGIVLGYYFGTSKTESDRSEKKQNNA